MTESKEKSPRFIVPLPGGGVARLPLDVLEAHRDDSTTSAHLPRPGETQATAHRPFAKTPGKTVNIDAGGTMITVNIFTQNQPNEQSGHDDRDVGPPKDAADDEMRDITAHSMAVDAATGLSDWHTDWEFGECEYTDESGFVQRLQAWHRHPFGTEYAELYEG